MGPACTLPARIRASGADPQIAVGLIAGVWILEPTHPVLGQIPMGTAVGKARYLAAHFGSGRSSMDGGDGPTCTSSVAAVLNRCEPHRKRGACFVGRTTRGQVAKRW